MMAIHLDPGYGNSEFNKIPILKPSLLTPWESERAFMPERSYKVPKGKTFL